MAHGAASFDGHPKARCAPAFGVTDARNRTTPRTHRVCFADPARAAFGDTKPAPSRYLLAGARVGRPYCSNDHLFLRGSGPTFFTRTGSDDFTREAWSVWVYMSVTFV